MNKLKSLVVIALLLGVPVCVFSQTVMTDPKQIWVTPAILDATKYIGNWAGTSSGYTRFTFAIPEKLNNITRARIPVIGNAGSNVTYDLHVAFSASGFPQNAFTWDQAGFSAAVTKGDLVEIDVLNFLTSALSAAQAAVASGTLFGGQEVDSVYASLFVVVTTGKNQTQPSILGMRITYDERQQVVDSRGQFIGIRDDKGILVSVSPNTDKYIKFDSNGNVELAPNVGNSIQQFYKGSDCTGDTFMVQDDSYIFRIIEPPYNFTRYIIASGPLHTIQFLSFWESGQCQNIPLTTQGYDYTRVTLPFGAPVTMPLKHCPTWNSVATCNK